MIGGIGNMLFSTSPKLQNGQDPSHRRTYGTHDNSTCSTELSYSLSSVCELIWQFSASSVIFENTEFNKGDHSAYTVGYTMPKQQMLWKVVRKRTNENMYQCRTDGKTIHKGRRLRWPMDGLMPWYDILNTLRRLTSLTLQQQSREADINIFFIYEHLAKIWMDHPQRQDLGTRNWKNVFQKICRSSGEKI